MDPRTLTEPGDYPDDRVKGLSLRVLRTKRVWSLRYRVGSRRPRVELGAYPDVGLAEARRKAKKELGRATDRSPDRAGTFGELAAQYLEEWAKPRKRTWRQDERVIEKELLPLWRHRKPSQVERRDVRALLRTIEKRGALTRSNRVRVLVSKIFNWGIAEDLVDNNPALGLHAAPDHPQGGRDEVLSDRQLKKIFEVLETDQQTPASALLHTLIYTIQRPRMLQLSRWDLVTDGWLECPGYTTKNGRAHWVYLTESCLEPLVAFRDFFGAEFLFPSTKGSGHLKTYNKALSRFHERCGFRWGPREIRRTGYTRLSALGVPPHIKAAVVGHSPKDVGGIHYDRYTYADEVRSALQSHSDLLDSLR